ncbi:threonine/serine exporter family protein [Actinoplanes sp. NPDC023714]|uniref:threonine/serine ThrE exporter family protein n=1 Tax=Actinoplanes sp. NPDC023714 TaxID=3154322 RepID=UPI00340B0B94
MTTEKELLALLGPLTEWLLATSFEGTMTCEATVRDVAARYGHDVEVVFLADAALLTVGDRTLSFAREPGVPPLDEVSERKRLIAAIHAGLPADRAAARLAEIRAMPPRWRRPAQVLGLIAFTVGFGISVQATWQQVGVSALTGLLAGLIVVVSAGRRRLVLVSPFVASVLVTAIVVTLSERGLIDGGPIQLIVPALFYFIPGDAITAAALELASNRMTAGAARLIYSLAVLLVLAFGALVATVLLRVPASALFDVPVDGNLGPALVWGGWVLFAAGVMLTFSMAPRDFPWALALILLTAAVTEVAVRAFGDPFGTFAGAVVMTVAALRLGRRPAFPPAYVLYLGAFYVLTPGSHGLRGLESWIGGNPITGVGGLADMVGLLIAVAVGMLVGAAVSPVGDRLSPARGEA